MAYCIFHHKNMPFFFKDDLTLAKYCTTKVDYKNKVSKLPKEKPQYLDINSLKTNDNSKGRSEIVFCRERSSSTIAIDHFNPIKVLGKGAFGNVMLCQMKDSNELYAVKSVRKEDIIEKEQLEKAKT